MSILTDGELIRVSGVARIEDAETLAGLLRANPGHKVDLTQAGTLHAAVVQVLLAFRPGLVGPAGDPFVNTWLLPALRHDGEPSPPALRQDAQYGIKTLPETL